MGINSTGLPLSQGAGEENNQRAPASDAKQVLSSTKLRCVECLALYPAIEAGQSALPIPRYRCDCGGVLDVETQFRHPDTQNSFSPDFFDIETHALPASGALWRQLFDERIAGPPIWAMSTDTHLLDTSGVWRYRELILSVPDSYVISRPEGNTTLYPVGRENCGPGRIGHR